MFLLYKTKFFEAHVTQDPSFFIAIDKCQKYAWRDRIVLVRFKSLLLCVKYFTKK